MMHTLFTKIVDKIYKAGMRRVLVSLKSELDLWYEMWDRAGSQGLDTWYEIRGRVTSEDETSPARGTDDGLGATTSGCYEGE
jgi:hypothetical protein